MGSKILSLLHQMEYWFKLILISYSLHISRGFHISYFTSISNYCENKWHHMNKGITLYVEIHQYKIDSKIFVIRTVLNQSVIIINIHCHVEGIINLILLLHIHWFEKYVQFVFRSLSREEFIVYFIFLVLHWQHFSFSSI